MPYRVEFRPTAAEELRAIRAFDRRRIMDEAQRQLSHQPTVTTRNRKCLPTASPRFEHRPPIWELRIGDFRVFYDVDAITETVYVRAVRRKEAQQITEDIL